MYIYVYVYICICIYMYMYVCVSFKKLIDVEKDREVTFWPNV